MFTLGRKLDINYGTNKLIISLSILAGLLGGIRTGEIKSGLYIGLGTFISWALAREVDPGHEKSAFLGVAFSSINIFYYEKIEILLIFWLILIMRMISGISGKELEPLDFIVLLGMSLYLSANNQNTIYLLIFLLAMAILILLKEKKKLAIGASSLAIIAFYIVEKMSIGTLSLNRPDPLNTINIFAINLVSLSFFFWTYMSKGKIKDDQGNLVNRARVEWSQIIYNISFLLIFFLGEMAINNLIIYLSVTTGVIIYNLGLKLIKKTA